MSDITVKFIDKEYSIPTDVITYTDLRELTPEVLRTFIERIIIHERTAKHSKTASQQIDIYFRYIGKLAPRTSRLNPQNGIGRTAEPVRPTPSTAYTQLISL